VFSQHLILFASRGYFSVLMVAMPQFITSTIFYTPDELELQMSGFIFGFMEHVY
jgi:hypothetical protein